MPKYNSYRTVQCHVYSAAGCMSRHAQCHVSMDLYREHLRVYDNFYYYYDDNNYYVIIMLSF